MLGSFPQRQQSLMGVLKILFPLLALVALASSAYAQDPHSLLWDDKPDEAMKLLKADPVSYTHLTLPTI